jgi:hypothetical protein
LCENALAEALMRQALRDLAEHGRFGEFCGFVFWNRR